MSIRPPSDIILDVAKNADSGREAAAVRRLEALGGENSVGGAATFASTLDQFTPPRPSTTQSANAVFTPVTNHPKSSPRSPDRVKQVAQDFEATLLNSFVSEMMPKESSAYFGQGNTGDMWKSMLSEQIAHQLAKSGTLGLARRLFATHPIESLRGHHGAASASAEATRQTAQASSQLLSSPTNAGGALRTHRI